MFLSRFGSALAILLLCSSISHADLSYSPHQTPDGTRYIVVEGSFSHDDSIDGFSAAIGGHNPSIVVFNSPGGNVIKAMEFGRLIRALRLNTVQFRQLECSSACALAFLGGVERFAEAGSIGVHKSSFSRGMVISADDAVSVVQQLTAKIIGYMIEMGADPALLELSFQYEPDDIRYLSRSEMEQYRVLTVAQRGGQETGPMSRAPAPFTPAPAEHSIDLSIPAARSGRVLHPRGSAPLKSIADGNSSDLGTLRNGQPVSILSSHDRWYRVQAGHHSGFMHHTWIFVDQFGAGPYGQRHVQVKSVRTLLEAETYLRSSSLPLSIYLATNGWFAITLAGTYDQSQALSLLQSYKGSGGIPDDSFATYGTTYARKICCS